MKNYLLILLLTISSAKAIACDCVVMRPFQTLEDLKGYEFIAHVKIVNDHDKEPPSNSKGFSFDKVDIQVLELFKGKMTNEIYEANKSSFCSMNIVNGQEWIFFGVRSKGKLVVWDCDYNLIYRDADGQRDWEYQRGFREIKLLRELFGIPKRKYANGKHSEFYDNGKIEMEENFENNVRVGERKIWHLNGILASKESFVNDSLDGKLERYYLTGQLKEVEFYKKGKPYNVHRRYNDTTNFNGLKYEWIENFDKIKDSLKNEYKRLTISLEQIYNSDGEKIAHRSFDRLGRLQLEVIYDPATKISTRIYYHKNGGTIHSISYEKRENGYDHIGHYQTYDEFGLPEDSWDYIDSGKRINEKITPRIKKLN
jgi:antitoxin component YwqK of YwqJK toxin-antitoxin module